MSVSENQVWTEFKAEPNEKNFEAVYRVTSPLVYTICRKMLRNEEDALDAFQSSYARILEIARMGKGGDEDMITVVRTMTVREADSLRHRRKRKQTREIADEAIAFAPDPALSAAETLSREERLSLVESIIAKLGDDDRIPIQLHFFHGMTLREIAEGLNKPLTTISSRISRALKKLEPMLRSAGIGEIGAVIGTGALGVELIAPPASVSAATVYGFALTTPAKVTLSALIATKLSYASAVLTTKSGAFAIGTAFGAMVILALAFSNQKPIPSSIGLPQAQSNVAGIITASASETPGSASNSQATDSDSLDRTPAKMATPNAPITSPAASGTAANAPIKDSSDDTSNLMAATGPRTPPKVGLFLCASTSEYSDEFSDPMTHFSRDYYLLQFSISGFKGLGFEVYAVVEPNTESNPKIAALLKRFKLEDRVINGADVEALKTLDGVCSALNTRIPDDVVSAFTQASKAGVGFVIIGNFGSESPGNSDEIREFIGISQAKENFRTFERQGQDLIKFEIVAPEELMVGAFDRNASPGIQMEFVCGYTGPVDGTPLLALPDGMDPDFCPAFIRQNGKGRVAVLQPFINTSNVNMVAIMNAVRVTANWACKRPLDADWKAIRSEMAAAQASQSTAASPAESTGVKVGVVISHLTEQRPNFDYQKVSSVIGIDPYANALGAMVVGLQTAGAVPYILLDEGEVERADSRTLLDQAGWTGRIMDWKSAEDLKQVEVIIIYFCPFLSGKLIDDIYSSVNSGSGLIVIGEIGVEKADDEVTLDALLGLSAAKGNIQIFSDKQQGTWQEHPDFPGALSNKGTGISFWHVAAYSGQPEGSQPLFSLNASSEVSAGYTRRLGSGRLLVFPFMAVYAADTDWDPRYFLQDDNSIWGDALRWAAGK